MGEDATTELRRGTTAAPLVPVERSKRGVSNYRLARRVKTVMSSTRSIARVDAAFLMPENAASSCRVFGTIAIRRAISACEIGSKRRAARGLTQ